MVVSAYHAFVFSYLSFYHFSPSIYLLCIYPPIHVYMYPSIHSSIHSSTHPSVYLTTYLLSLFLPLFLSVCLSYHLSVSPHMHTFIFIFVLILYLYSFPELNLFFSQIDMTPTLGMKENAASSWCWKSASPDVVLWQWSLHHRGLGSGDVFYDQPGHKHHSFCRSHEVPIWQSWLSFATL